MTDNVIAIESHRPHLRVTGRDGGEYIIPVQLALDIASGRKSSSLLDDPCIQTIVLEWLLSLGVEDWRR